VKIGLFIGIIATGLVLMMTAFSNSATPYASAKEAKAAPGKKFHVVGTIVPGSLDSNVREGTVNFLLKDELGETISVHYKGHAPANLATATKVNAVGKFENGTYKSEKLLLKCPTKYEPEKKGA